ncbi:hypothetical protein SDC9_96015 [bioreactor metagenome]|uniref:Uncharacterized protein n=1 Tax=bioreactor metagenome TaxID=1076179 RepID=A0A645A8N3_9ZZZZ
MLFDGQDRAAVARRGDDRFPVDGFDRVHADQSDADTALLQRFGGELAGIADGTGEEDCESPAIANPERFADFKRHRAGMNVLFAFVAATVIDRSIVSQHRMDRRSRFIKVGGGDADHVRQGAHDRQIFR